MNPLEAQLDYPFGNAVPDNGCLLEVAPGVKWLRVTLPFALNHINLWLLEDERQTETGLEQGWTIVDCGVSNDTTRAAWEKIFATQLEGKPVLRVIATHCHPDHVGLADWICTRWQAPLWMSAGEYGFARMMSAGLPGAGADHGQRRRARVSAPLLDRERALPVPERLDPEPDAGDQAAGHGLDARRRLHEWLLDGVVRL